MNILSVNMAQINQSLFRVDYILVEGVLSYESNRYCLYNWPRPELILINGEQYLPCITFKAAGNFKLEEAVLNKWVGKRVIVGGYTPLGHGAYRHGFDNCLNDETYWGLEVTQVYLYNENGNY